MRTSDAEGLGKLETTFTCQDVTGQCSLNPGPALGKAGVPKVWGTRALRALLKRWF